MSRPTRAPSPPAVDPTADPVVDEVVPDPGPRRPARIGRAGTGRERLRRLAEQIRDDLDEQIAAAAANLDAVEGHAEHLRTHLDALRAERGDLTAALNAETGDTP